MDYNLLRALERIDIIRTSKDPDDICLFGIYCDTIEKDKHKAFDLYKKSSNLGSSLGHVYLGSAYFGGRVIQDDEKAVQLFSKSIEIDNDSLAYAMLGNCYENGFGVEKDLKKAVELYTTSSELGNPRGHAYLGYCYEYGIGVERDEDVALKLYVKAAKGNSVEGTFYLKKMLTRQKTYFM